MNKYGFAAVGSNTVDKASFFFQWKADGSLSLALGTTSCMNPALQTEGMEFERYELMSCWIFRNYEFLTDSR